MNFDRWKKLSKHRQTEMAKNWDLRKNEGRDLATTVLKVFIKKYGSNKYLKISDDIARGNDRWIIFVRCLDGSSLPESFMGIKVIRHHYENIDRDISLEDHPPMTERFQQHRDFKCIGFLASNGRNTVASLDFYTPNRATASSLKRFSV
jgi:hypothetical protein